MTMKEIVDLYLPEEDKEWLALKNLILSNVKIEHAKIIEAALHRADIFTIDDLHKTSEEDIKRFRRLDPERVDEVINLKSVIRDLLSKGV